MFKAVLDYTEASKCGHKKLIKKKVGKRFGEFGLGKNTETYYTI
jgi:hypothetical protein